MSYIRLGFKKIPFASKFKGQQMPQQNRRNGNAPIYKKIQKRILKKVAAGRLKPGDAVDSERELARIHGVSLMTARHALAGLERTGLVERRCGLGTFIAAPKINFNKLMSYTEQMGSHSLPVSSKCLSCTVIHDEHEIAARLSSPPGSQLIELKRLRLGAAEPLAIETCYLPAKQFEGLISAPLERASLFFLLKHDYGIEIARG